MNLPKSRRKLLLDVTPRKRVYTFFFGVKNGLNSFFFVCFSSGERPRRKAGGEEVVDGPE